MGLSEVAGEIGELGQEKASGQDVTHVRACMAKVKADLNRDVALGALEKVLENTQVMWQSSMHVVARKDGSCRRPLDLPLLNAATYHQMKLTESQFVQASIV